MLIRKCSVLVWEIKYLKKSQYDYKCFRGGALSTIHLSSAAPCIGSVLFSE